MNGSLVTGAHYLVRGFHALRQRKVWPFVILPLCINLIIFILLSQYLITQGQYWVTQATGWLPDWLDFLGKLIWLITSLLILLIWVFCFTLVASFIASPFYGFLSAVVQTQYDGSSPANNRSLWQEVPHALGRELSKYAYYLPRLLLLFLLSWIPPLTLVAPFLWFFFAAWMLAIQYLDYPADNQAQPLSTMIATMKNQRLTYLGFGGLISIGMMIPLINLIVMPASVAGATLLYLDQNTTSSLEPYHGQ